MKIITAFKDFVEHLSIFKEAEMARIEATTTTCRIGFIDRKLGIVLWGEMNEPIDGMVGIFGIGNIPHMRKILFAPGFDTANATGAFTARSLTETAWASGDLDFDNGTGQSYCVSLASKEMIEHHMPVPPVKGSLQFDTPFAPTNVGIELLKYWHEEMLSTYKAKYVGFFNRNGSVKCGYRFSEVHKYEFPFKSGVNSILKNTWRYPAEKILAVLQLYSTSKSVAMSLCDEGLMKIEVDSGLGKYCYYFAAQQESTRPTEEYKKRSDKEMLAHHIAKAKHFEAQRSTSSQLSNAAG